MRCEGLAAEERAVVWYRCFKALGVNAPVWELTLFCARFFRLADASDVAQDVSESAAEDVAFVVWHLQRFLDSIGEAVACEAEVLEHYGFNGSFHSLKVEYIALLTPSSINRS